MESKEKRTWEGDNAHSNFRSKSNNGRKKSTDYEIIDRIAEQTASVIIQVKKESKSRIHPKL